MLFILTGSYLQAMYTGEPTDAEFYPYWIGEFISFTLASLPLCYLLYLILAKVLPTMLKLCIQGRKKLVKKFFTLVENQSEEEDRALLPEGENSVCHML